jgi:meso-butanediol dehydrogenase / (S,S)-butanediol dehydrogenase / diacetyl reductase
MEQRFLGKTVIVTGASSGIGLGTARRFAAEGADLVVAARRQDRLDDLVKEIGSDRAVAVRVDVTDEEDMNAMAATAVERFGRIDVLVSNAGAGLAKPFRSLTLADWRGQLDLNLTSCYLGAQACVAALTESKGSIIHTASASGLGGDAGLTAYNAAKGGVVNFTRGLAFDLGRSGVRVNAVAPSLTIVDPDDAVLTPEFQAGFTERRALHGHASPDDVAAAIAFLASADARFITGAVLPIDGGITAGSGQPRF